MNKYYELTQLWPNKAGKLKSLLTVQKRSVEKLAKEKQNDEVKKLLITDAEINEVASETIEYIHGILKEIAKDFQTYEQGAKYRAIIEEQSEHLKYYFNELRRKN
jgi:hypothetical protein